jgi:hypothetical protein
MSVPPHMQLIGHLLSKGYSVIGSDFFEDGRLVGRFETNPLRVYPVELGGEFSLIAGKYLLSRARKE